MLNKWEKLVFLALFALGIGAALAGCKAVNTVAAGIADKSLSGSGVVSVQRVGIDPENQTPVLRSTVITGDYASAKAGEVAFQYRRRKSPSIFNKDAVSEETTINYIGGKKDLSRAEALAKADLNQAILDGNSGNAGKTDSGVADDSGGVEAVKAPAAAETAAVTQTPAETTGEASK